MGFLYPPFCRFVDSPLPHALSLPRPAHAIQSSGSLERDPSRRALLVELDVAINRLNQRIPETQELVHLTGCYQNLLRMWAEL